MEANQTEVSYVGFWLRLLAQIVDTALGLLFIVPLLYGIYGTGFMDFGRLMSAPVEYLLAYQPQTGALDYVISYGLPAVAIVAFWLTRQATPGKMLVSARVVDAGTHGRIGTGQAIGRYLFQRLKQLTNEPFLARFREHGIIADDKYSGVLKFFQKPFE